ncbi:MAG: hypothetical protein ABI865_09520 [Nitrosospira sp.]
MTRGTVERVALRVEHFGADQLIRAVRTSWSTTRLGCAQLLGRLRCKRRCDEILCRLGRGRAQGSVSGERQGCRHRDDEHLTLQYLGWEG